MCVPQNESVLACVLTGAGQGWFRVRERLVVVIKQADERRWILVLSHFDSLPFTFNPKLFFKVIFSTFQNFFKKR